MARILLMLGLAWGHVPGKEWLLLPGEKIYLINQKQGVPYRVCLAEETVRKYPGLPDEIDAALNIWAHYLDRNIPVTFVQKAVPRTSGMDREAVRAVYAKACGAVDMMVAFGGLPGAALGETGFRRIKTTGRRGGKPFETLQAAGRMLMLRDLETTPFRPEPRRIPLRWRMYRDLGLGTGTDREAILRTLKSRSKALYSYDGGVPMLAVLVHEFGHVWGLCDLYASEQLCDAKFAGDIRPKLGQFVVMGPVVFRQQLYLADDDIFGIRALATRPGFAAGWPQGKAFAAPLPLALPDVEIMEVEIAKSEKRKLVLECHVITNRPAKYRIEARPKGERRSDAWRPLVQESATARITEPRLLLTIEMKNDPQDLEVRLRVVTEKKGGGWSEARYAYPGRA